MVKDIYLNCQFIIVNINYPTKNINVKEHQVHSKTLARSVL